MVNSKPHPPEASFQDFADAFNVSLETVTIAIFGYVLTCDPTDRVDLVNGFLALCNKGQMNRFSQAALKLEIFVFPALENESLAKACSLLDLSADEAIELATIAKGVKPISYRLSADEVKRLKEAITPKLLETWKAVI